MQTQERQPLSAPASSLCLLHNRTDDATRFGYLCSILFFLSIHDGTVIIYLRHDAVGVPLKGIILLCAVGTIATNDEIQTMLHGFLETQVCTKSTTHLQTQRGNREWGEEVLISNRSRSCRVRECRLVLLEVE